MVSGPVRCSFALRPAGSLTRRPGLLHQGLRAFHCFKARLGCYRLERKLPGGFALPLEFCAFPRRTQTRSKVCTRTCLFSWPATAACPATVKTVPILSFGI